MGVALRQIKAKVNGNKPQALFALEGVESARVVGRNVLLSEFCFWKRCVIRFCYFLTNYAPGDAISLQAICTTKEIAQSFARDGSYFGCELPVDENLPHSPVQFGEFNFPLAPPDVFNRYAAAQHDLVSVRRQDFAALRSEVKSVFTSAQPSKG